MLIITTDIVTYVNYSRQMLLENQMEMEKMKTESEKKRVLLLHEQLREKVWKIKLNWVVLGPLCAHCLG